MFDKPRRVYVSERDFMSRVWITFITRTPEGRMVDYYDPSTRQWRREAIHEHMARQGPTLALDEEDAIDLYQEMHRYFSARGVRNKHESFVEGELAGTKRHLVDLRHLLKLPERKDGEPHA